MAHDSAYVRFALRVLGEMSAIILLPAFAALGITSFVASRPAKLGLFAIAFALSAFALVRRARSFGREFDRMNKV